MILFVYPKWSPIRTQWETIKSHWNVISIGCSIQLIQLNEHFLLLEEITAVGTSAINVLVVFLSVLCFSLKRFIEIWLIAWIHFYATLVNYHHYHNERIKSRSSLCDVYSMEAWHHPWTKCMPQMWLILKVAWIKTSYSIKTKCADCTDYTYCPQYSRVQRRHKLHMPGLVHW